MPLALSLFLSSAILSRLTYSASFCSGIREKGGGGGGGGGKRARGEK